MTLRRRVMLTALAVAVPTAAAVVAAIEWRRAADMRVQLVRIAEAHLTESVRDQCEADPQWFLAGPRTGRPSFAARQRPDADVFLPRPDADQRPFEVFAYNDQFSPTSTAGPRFPVDFRDEMRASPPRETMIGPWESEAGDGLQLARLTGWSSGPCAVLLFRLQPVSGQFRQRAIAYGLLVATMFAAMMLAFAPSLYRLRRTSLAIGRAAREDYASVAPDDSKDEISAVAYVFNDAAKEIHTRRDEIRDRSEALRRHVEHTREDVARPLFDLEARLAELNTAPSLPADARVRARALQQDAHDTAVRLENFIAAAELRSATGRLPVEPVDVRDVVRRVLSRYEPLVRHAGLVLRAELPDEPVPGAVHAWIDRALGNLLDNAIAAGRPGSAIVVSVERGQAPQTFAIRVTDTGRGASDELFKGLTAIRRFRGDEGWNRRPNAPGLGLAVAREIADRSGLDLELRRPEAGGFEAEIRTTGTRGTTGTTGTAGTAGTR